MRMKYPRTLHLPFSLGNTNDDKMLLNIDHFIDQDIVVTVKMDGENTSIYKDYTHARSMDSSNHVSRDWIKNKAKEFQYLLTENMRVCGENLYARHSIKYSNLESYFYIFSIWDNDLCLSWDETVELCEKYSIPHVPILYRGKFDLDVLTNLYSSEYNGDEMEGFVVRNSKSFSYENFNKNVAKYVRKGHVQTDEHWMSQSVEKNGLRRLSC